jgi:hypothetical protein
MMRAHSAGHEISLLTVKLLPFLLDVGLDTLQLPLELLQRRRLQGRCLQSVFVKERG